MPAATVAPPPAAAAPPASAPPASSTPKHDAGAGAGAAPPKEGPSTAPEYLQEYDDDLDLMDGGAPDPKIARKNGKEGGKGVVQPPKGGDGTPPTAAPAGEKGKEGGAAPSAPKDDLEGPEPSKINDVRDWGRRLKKQIKEELTPKLAKAEARIKELEATGAVPETITKELETVKARNKQLEEEIGYVDYSKSTEFQDKYAKPYATEWARATHVLGQLAVREPDGVDEAGEPKFKLRAGTTDDLLELANTPLGKLDEKAEAMFGKSAARVIRLVENVRELAEKQDSAIADARKRAGETLKQRETNQKLNSQKGHEMWQNEHKRLLEKYPKMFGPDEKDPEGNQRLEKGEIEAKIVFTPDKVPEDQRPKTAEEIVRVHARAYQKIKNHDRMVLRLKAIAKELADTKKALSEFEASEPDGGRSATPGQRGGGANWQDEANAELDALDKRR